MYIEEKKPEKVVENNTIEFDEKGYINITKICSVSGKKLAKWKYTKNSKLILEIASKILNMNKKELMYYRLGKNTERGTFVHPHIAHHIAMWCSPEFSIRVSQMIDEWKQTSYKNQQKFITYINEIKPSCHNKNYEFQIRNNLSKELNGDIEVKCPIGIIDIVTNDTIIEVKFFNNWKHAFGQILAYSTYYKTYKRRIHLFDFKERCIDNIQEITKEYNIQITFEIIQYEKDDILLDTLKQKIRK